MISAAYPPHEVDLAYAGLRAGGILRRAVIDFGLEAAASDHGKDTNT